MAYNLNSELCDSKQIEVVAGAAKTKGTPEVVNNVLGFWFTDTANAALGTFIIGGQKVLADCDSAVTFNAGDSVYDATVAPTGIVNKTSGAGRTKVGYACKSYVLGTSQIHIVFDGGNSSGA
jgi:hypothetical protein